MTRNFHAELLDQIDKVEDFVREASDAIRGPNSYEQRRTALVVLASATEQAKDLLDRYEATRAR